ncbi:MAG: YitT family protein [Actinomycetes bacterium]
MNLKNLLRPHRTIPRTSWTAHSPWSLSISRVLILTFGLTIFGFGEALLIQSTLGNAPWSVLSQGISRHSSLSLGWATFYLSIVVLLGWVPLKQRPGFGTLANIVVIAFSLQIGTDIFPIQHHTLWIRLAYVFGGIALIGCGSSFYITCGLGPGPRDGLMTGIHRVTGIRVGRVRLFIEIIVLSIGWAAGGRVGIGTLCFALFIGNSVAIWLGLVRHLENAIQHRRS